MQNNNFSTVKTTSMHYNFETKTVVFSMLLVSTLKKLVYLFTPAFVFTPFFLVASNFSGTVSYRYTNKDSCLTGEGLDMFNIDGKRTKGFSRCQYKRCRISKDVTSSCTFFLHIIRALLQCFNLVRLLHVIFTIVVIFWILKGKINMQLILVLVFYSKRAYEVYCVCTKLVNL